MVNEETDEEMRIKALTLREHNVDKLYAKYTRLCKVASRGIGLFMLLTAAVISNVVYEVISSRAAQELSWENHEKKRNIKKHIEYINNCRNPKVEEYLRLIKKNPVERYLKIHDKTFSDFDNKNKLEEACKEFSELLNKPEVKKFQEVEYLSNKSNMPIYIEKDNKTELKQAYKELSELLGKPEIKALYISETRFGNTNNISNKNNM